MRSSCAEGGAARTGGLDGHIACTTGGGNPLSAPVPRRPTSIMRHPFRLLAELEHLRPDDLRPRRHRRARPRRLLAAFPHLRHGCARCAAGPATLAAATAIDLFEDQVLSRQLDSRRANLKSATRASTRSAAGHENNAVLGAALRLTDMAFLHYRSGGVHPALEAARRARRPVWDMLLASSPSSRGPDLRRPPQGLGQPCRSVPPQTSTIASHLPKAVGQAFSSRRARRPGVERRAAGRRDRAVQLRRRVAQPRDRARRASTPRARPPNSAMPMPIVFVCEDNGIGIACRHPAAGSRRPSRTSRRSRYSRRRARSTTLCDAPRRRSATRARTRRPAFLHLQTVRLLGHAGSDVEDTYRTPRGDRGGRARDPLLAPRGCWSRPALLPPEELGRSYDDDARARRCARPSRRSRRPKLATARRGDGAARARRPARRPRPRPRAGAEAQRDALRLRLPRAATSRSDLAG